MSSTIIKPHSGCQTYSMGLCGRYQSVFDYTLSTFTCFSCSPLICLINQLQRSRTEMHFNLPPPAAPHRLCEAAASHPAAEARAGRAQGLRNRFHGAAKPPGQGLLAVCLCLPWPCWLSAQASTRHSVPRAMCLFSLFPSEPSHRSFPLCLLLLHVSLTLISLALYGTNTT